MPRALPLRLNDAVADVFELLDDLRWRLVQLVREVLLHVSAQQGEPEKHVELVSEQNTLKDSDKYLLD